MFALVIAAALAPAADPPVDVMKDIYPFLRKHCVSCHNAAAPRAERSLTDYQDAKSILRDADAWDDILRLTAEKAMPPAESRGPAAGAIDRFVRAARRLRESPVPK